MRGRTALAAIALGIATVVGVGGGLAAAATTSQPVTCDYDGATLSCPIPQTTSTATTTESTTATVTADPITVFTTAVYTAP